MKKINNLSKEVLTTKRKRTKAKSFNLKKGYYHENIHRLFNFLGDKVTGDVPRYEDLIQYKDILEEISLEINVFERESVIKAFNQTKFKSSEYLEVNSKNDFYTETFEINLKNIILGVDCDSKILTFNHSLNLKKSGRYYVVPLRTFLGLLELYRLLKENFNEIKNILITPKIKNLSCFKYDYSNICLSDVLDVLVFDNISTLLRINDDRLDEEFGLIKYFMLDFYIIYQAMIMNFDLNKEYLEENNKECARAFETKKSINKSTSKMMEESTLNKYFSFVEFDNEVDMKKEAQIEKEFKYLYTALNLQEFLDGQTLDFRIRKLGKHKALGIYFPSKKCLCIDASSPKSFMHEFGHFIDFTYEGSNLSNSIDFIHIIIKYTNSYNDILKSNKTNTTLKSKANYFTTPTEIFARAFEFYLAEIGVFSSLTRSYEEMNINSGYIFDNEVKSDIIEYFDKLIQKMNVNLNVIEELDKKTNIKLVANIQNIEIKELILDNNNQFAFDI